MADTGSGQLWRTAHTVITLSPRVTRRFTPWTSSRRENSVHSAESAPTASIASIASTSR